MKLFAHELCCAITNAFTSQSRNIRLRWEGIAAETLPCKLQSRAYGVQDWLPDKYRAYATLLVISESRNPKYGRCSTFDLPYLGSLQNLLHSVSFLGAM